MSSPLVQYILVIREAMNGWTTGAIIAQACHAVTKCTSTFFTDPHMTLYMSNENISQMRKVVLGCSRNEWETIKEKANKMGADYCEWTEQPEDVVTCVAFKPAFKDSIGHLFSGLKLFS